MKNEHDKTPVCPECGTPMHFFYGGMWDYDRWMCTKQIGVSASGYFKEFCKGEIELETSTTPPELEAE